MTDNYFRNVETIEELPNDCVWMAQPKKNPNTKQKPWEVKRQDNQRASKDFKNQKKAWEKAKELAQKNGTYNNPTGARKKNSQGQITQNEFYPKK